MKESNKSGHHSKHHLCSHLIVITGSPQMFMYIKMLTMFLPSRWTNLNESVRSGLAVLDVTIPTGYIVQQQDLDAYIRSRQVRNLQRARFQERKVLFYFDFVSVLYCWSSHLMFFDLGVSSHLTFSFNDLKSVLLVC
jgi:hypothetical protein